MLFPNPDVCKKNIDDFNNGITQDRTKRDNRDYINLNRIIGMDVSRNNSDAINQNLLRMLGSFQAFRNQPASKNVHFIESLINDENVCNSFNRLINSIRTNNRLDKVLSEHNDDLGIAYNFTQENILLKPFGRIVTVSKALMMLVGINLGFDGSNIAKINAHRCPKIKPAQWTYNEFFGVLKFVNQEIIKWEDCYKKSFTGLEPNMPIGIIADKVLFRDETKK